MYVCVCMDIYNYFSIVVKEHPEQVTYKKKVFNWDLLTTAEGESMAPMMGSLAAEQQHLEQ